MAQMTTKPARPAGPPATWHDHPGAEVAAALGVDPERGLTAAEAQSRLQQYGPNRFAEAATEPRWRGFARQYRDGMQIVLVVAGVGSILIKQWGTGAVLLLLTVFNAVLGLRQEGKAAAAVAALQKMMIIKAKVRRDGELLVIPAHELVP